MAVLKKIRSRWWSQGEESAEPIVEYDSASASQILEVRYDVRPLTVTQLTSAGGSTSAASLMAKPTAATLLNIC